MRKEGRVRKGVNLTVTSTAHSRTELSPLELYNYCDAFASQKISVSFLVLPLICDTTRIVNQGQAYMARVGVIVIVFLHLSDINECSDGSHTCDSNATCSDTAGSFTCQCTTGFTGDGQQCSGRKRN